MTSPILNVDAVVFESRPAARAPTGAAAERIEARFAQVGSRIGAKQLGYNITAVPPGKSAFPCHNHWVNEEMVFVLQGTGTLRIGTHRYPLRAGDFVALPAGGRETAHEIVNTGDDELRYIAVATETQPEICEYPDSGKFGVYADTPPDAEGQSRFFRFLSREDQSLSYWDGE